MNFEFCILNSSPILESQYIGDDFVRQNSAAVLKAPSSTVPLSYNYLINPQHPDAGKIRVVSKMAVVFDERMGKGKRD